MNENLKKKKTKNIEDLNKINHFSIIPPLIDDDNQIFEDIPQLVEIEDLFDQMMDLCNNNPTHIAFQISSKQIF